MRDGERGAVVVVGVVLVALKVLFASGVTPGGRPPRKLWLNLFGPVGFLCGDSGRGREGREAGLRSCGLGARTPGPTDCVKLGLELLVTERLNLGIEGVCGLWLLARVPLLSSSELAKEGVVGVGGKLPVVDAGDECLVARCAGRKIPEPGMDVAKYLVLSLN